MWLCLWLYALFWVTTRGGSVSPEAEEAWWVLRRVVLAPDPESGVLLPMQPNVRTRLIKAVNVRY